MVVISSFICLCSCDGGSGHLGRSWRSVFEEVVGLGAAEGVLLLEANQKWTLSLLGNLVALWIRLLLYDAIVIRIGFLNAVPAPKRLLEGRSHAVLPGCCHFFNLDSLSLEVLSLKQGLECGLLGNDHFFAPECLLMPRSLGNLVPLVAGYGLRHLLQFLHEHAFFGFEALWLSL